MTKPAASRQNRFQKRVYPIPRPDNFDIVELPAVSRLEATIYSFPLEAWKLTTVAQEIATRQDLQILACTDPKEAYKQALNAGQRAANIGTSVHALSEQYEDGTLDMKLVANKAKPWLESYVKAKERYGWTVLHMEQTCYNFELKYAGTFDRIMNLPGEGITLTDIKSGKGVYGSSAAQQALYAYAEGIFVPPDSCPEANKRRDQLERNIQANTNVPEGRRGWSKAAQDAAYAEQDAFYWAEYARLGKHLPMPDGLRRDKAFLLHLFDDRPGELVPLRLDADLPRSISFMFHWDQDRTILGDPLPAVNVVTEKVTEEKGTRVSVGDLGMKVVQEANFEGLCNALAARARILPKNLQADLKKNWPADIPSLKEHQNYTGEAIDIIEALIREREMALRVQNAFPGSRVE